MTEVLWGATFVAVALLITFLALVRRVAAPSRTAEGDLGTWLDSFSVARYRPMERLLSEADYEFLAAQPGYDPSIARPCPGCGNDADGAGPSHPPGLPS
jgi:hypothetical protein